MGDLLSPRRRDVLFDRLRRRIEHYRQQHHRRAGEFQPLANGLYKRYQSDTSLLQQRWQESRAKRTSKTGKSSSVDQVTGEQPYTQSKLKRKSSGSQRAVRLSTTTTATAKNTGADTDDIDHASSNTGHGSVNSGQASKSQYSATTDTGQTSSVHTSTTTSHSSVNASHSPASSAPIEHSVSVNIVQQIGTAPISTVTADAEASSHIKLTVSSTVRTGLECKREPQEHPCSADSSNSSHTSLPNSIGIDDVDELQAILDTLEKEADLAPDLTPAGDPSLVKDECERRMFVREADRMYEESYPAMMAGYAGLDTYTARPMPAPPPPLLGGDTGPAAETLKQMAAQHQNHNPPRYNTATTAVQEFGDVFSPGYRPTPVTYTGSYPQMSGFTSAATGSQYPFERKAGMSYGGTRPLCHYSDSAVQSSLQQLQDQVQSHFSAGSAPPSHPGVLEMSQSQHMQLSHAGRAMHVSQTQQMRFAVPDPSAGFPPQMYAADQMYEQQQQHQHQQQQQQHQQAAAYMSRAPPSYKPTCATATAAYDNPLQTMQSMVSGTQLPPAHGVKLEGRTQQNTPYKVGRAKNAAATSAYTSTLMRGQRPPNVNVGPDGLNISQQRSGAWIRPCTRVMKPPVYNTEGYSLVPQPHMAAQHHGGLGHVMAHPHAMSHPAAVAAPQYQTCGATTDSAERVPPIHPSMQQQQTMVTMQAKNQQMALPVSYSTNSAAGAAGGEFGMDFINGTESQTNYFAAGAAQTSVQPDFNFIDDFFAAK